MDEAAEPAQQLPTVSRGDDVGRGLLRRKKHCCLKKGLKMSTEVHLDVPKDVVKP